MSINNRLLVVDDEASVRHFLHELARKADYEVYLAANGLEAVEKNRCIKPAVIIMDIRMPVMNGMEAFQIIHQENPHTAVILATAYGTVDTAVQAMKQGAFDYLVKPSNITEVRSILKRAFQIQWLNEETNNHINDSSSITLKDKIIGSSVLMQQVYKLVGKVAPTNAAVLITGESGTGKELIAKTIHSNSLRNNGPFIKVNCGALPENLLESELFGHEKGAFTGAVAKKLGRFELAHHGTLFLDEVGELNLSLQVKLLRVLQEKEFERVGGTKTIKVDVRILAATNRNLEEMVLSGTFREDLYYRLKVIPIDVPPLRNRTDDIPLLIDYYINRVAHESNKERPFITSEARELLQQYQWPGNVRELSNVLERAVIMSNGIITGQDLPGITAFYQELPEITPHTGTLKEILHQVEKHFIARALKANHHNRVKTARALDISRRALLYKIEEYGLEESSSTNSTKIIG